MASTIFFENETGILRFYKDPIFPFIWRRDEPLYGDIGNKGFHRYILKYRVNEFELQFTGIPKSNYDEFINFLRDNSVRFGRFRFAYKTFYGENKWVKYVNHSSTKYAGKDCDNNETVLYDIVIVLRNLGDIE